MATIKLDEMGTIKLDEISTNIHFGTPCLICNESVKSYGIDVGPKICDKCKRAIMYIRKETDHDGVFRPPITQENKSQIYQQGWVCPKCGGVYGPMQSYCPHCTLPIKLDVNYATGIGDCKQNTYPSISVVANGSTKIN